LTRSSTDFTYFITMMERLDITTSTRSTANEPGRLGDQSRQMGRIRSRVNINVIEKTLVKLKL
jgi:hypothetical protein